MAVAPISNHIYRFVPRATQNSVFTSTTIAVLFFLDQHRICRYFLDIVKNLYGSMEDIVSNLLPTF